MNIILKGKALQALVSVIGIGAVGTVSYVVMNGSEKEAGGHAHAPDAGSHTHGEVIAGGKNSLYPVVSVVQPRSVSDADGSIEAAGQVLADKHADIYPRREGVVQSLSVNLGDTVKKGQVIASLQPDKDQSELSAELTFKQRELEIARERLTSSSETQETIAEVSLEAGKKNNAARLQKIDAEIEAIKISTTQAKSSVENAAYDLIDAATILMYTQTDAISRYNDYGPYDFYRRKEIFYPRDDEAKAVEQQLLDLFRGLKSNSFNGKPLVLVKQAMDTASAVRSITANASKVADYSDENANQRGEISEVVDHLAEISLELITSASTLSVLGAEKQSILAESTQNILEITNVGRGSQLDISLLEAEVERIRNQMGAARTVYAPFSGVITKRHINVGDSVNLDKPLFTLVDNNNMFVRFHITETDLPFITKDTVITFAPTSAPSHLHYAIIKRIAQAIDPDTRTILVEAELDPDDRDGHALSQMTVRAHIPTTHTDGLLSVPESAIELGPTSNQLWIVSAQVEAELRTVKVQYIHKSSAYIEEGLTGDEWVIVKSPVDLKENLEIDTTTES
jgi:RND family efflux transporter MFP subunit